MTVDDWLSEAMSDPDPASVLLAASDWCEENDRPDWAEHLRQEGSMIRAPFEAGQEWLICTVTLYYVGRVKEVGLGWVLLESASWVHWTGRLSVLTKLRRFTGNGFGARKPRTEHVGQVLVSTASIASAYPGPWELPKESVE